MAAPVCVVPLSVAGLVVVKPKPNPADLLAVLIAVLPVGTDNVVNAGMEVDTLLPTPVSEPEPKLKPVDPEPKLPVNPVKPLNAEVCTVHKILYTHPEL